MSANFKENRRQRRGGSVDSQRSPRAPQRHRSAPPVSPALAQPLNPLRLTAPSHPDTHTPIPLPAPLLLPLTWWASFPQQFKIYYYWLHTHTHTYTHTCYTFSTSFTPLTLLRYYFISRLNPSLPKTNHSSSKTSLYSLISKQWMSRMVHIASEEEAVEQLHLIPLSNEILIKSMCPQ